MLQLAAAAPGSATAASPGPTVSAAPPAAAAPASNTASKGSVTGAYLAAAIGILIGLAGLTLALGARRRPARLPTEEPAKTTVAR